MKNSFTCNGGEFLPRSIENGYLKSFILLVFIMIGLIFAPSKSFANNCPDIRIWVECIQQNPDGTFTANFGYKNPGNFYKVDATKSVLIYNGSQQKWPALNEFQPGVHRFVVQRAFKGKDRVKWRLTLPNGNVQEAEASSSTVNCVQTKLGISVTGPDKTYNGETVVLNYAVFVDPGGA